MAQALSSRNSSCWRCGGLIRRGEPIRHIQTGTADARQRTVHAHDCRTPQERRQAADRLLAKLRETAMQPPLEVLRLSLRRIAEETRDPEIIAAIPATQATERGWNALCAHICAWARARQRER